MTEHFDRETDAMSVLSAVFSRKWRLQVLQVLIEGPARLSELRRRIPAISKKVLLQVLQDLQNIGWVEKHDLSTRTKWVEYELTARHVDVLTQVLKSFRP